MSSCFDITQQALSYLLEMQVEDREKQMIILIKEVVDEWHEAHHNGCSELNRTPYRHTSELLKLLKTTVL
jgi:hypothetical protein